MLLGCLAVLAVVIVASMLSNARDRGPAAGGVAYQNEDYRVPSVSTNPPELEIPSTRTELNEWTTDNPLYRQSVPRPVRCEMDDLNLTQASRTQVSTHLNDLTGCLMRVWAEPMDQAGWTPVRFKTNVYGSTPITTPCGKIPARNAVFCYANQQMYYSMSLPEILPPDLRDRPLVVETVLAHEFGHGIQGRTGLAASALIAVDEAQGKPAQNQWKRRLEVQADCFAGQFVGSVAQARGMTETDVGNLTKVVESIGDDVLTGEPNYDGDHGLARTRS